MKINEVLKLRKDNIFGGAVQTEWYYDSRADQIASNFVFHGPNYFGVTDDDVEFKSHKLMDTCTYTSLLADRLYSDEGNPILLTIAGYGTGKSHLSVTLGKLFSEKKGSSLAKTIITNISRADNDLALDIKDSLTKPNFVIVLNGMRDFNLNYEVLNCAKRILKDYGYSDEIFAEFTKAYNIASNFVFKNFDKFTEEFKEAAEKNNINHSDLKHYMYENIYLDGVFNAVNDVYKEVTGEYIRWDEGISAGDVLRKLVDKFCGDAGEFNKILILFDEFGRYIEYASEYPNRAGDSTLQQIFEAIQDSNNKIIFNGFIQSDLKTYLARVNKTSNISRYIGRYEVGEKIYLSSNLETIFANLVEKNNHESFDYYINSYFEKDRIKENQRLLFNQLHQWIEATNSKGIWSNWDKYYQVIVKGIYPFSPISIWLLTSLSDWYQQRSALNFLINGFEALENEELHELGELPYIKPIDIIKGDLFQEILLAETEGRQKSEYCIQYEKMLTKYSDKLSYAEKDILAGILVTKLLRLRTKSKEECKLALAYITLYTDAQINDILQELENNQGIIVYDAKNNVYDFVEDATGIIDFNRMLTKKRSELNINIDLLFNQDICKRLEIDNNIVPEFAKKNFIVSNEWQYEISLIPISNIDNVFIRGLINDFEQKTTPDKPKGKLIYLYNNPEMGTEFINSVINLYNSAGLDNYPFIFILLDDKENDLLEVLKNDMISRRFTMEERMKFGRFIAKFDKEIEENLSNIFNSLVRQRLIIDSEGITNYSGRLGTVCNNKFEQLYTELIPFDFVGFNNKVISAAKKIHSSICKNIMSGMINYQWIQTQNKEVANRLQSLLVNSNSGWGVLNVSPTNTEITIPRNPKVKKLFDDMDNTLDCNGEIALGELRIKYTKPPYGLNDYAFSLLIAIYVHNRSYEARMEQSGSIVNSMLWSNSVFNEKALDYVIINNSKIKKINLAGYEAEYLSLLSKIEKNSDIEQCALLQEQLNKLQSEADVPEELKEKVRVCNSLLSIGFNYCNKVNMSLARMSGKLDKAIEGNNYIDVLKVIEESEEIESLIDDPNYSINGNQREEATKINRNARKHIEGTYENFLPRATCNSIAQVTRYENWMKSMSDLLKKLGYQELASKTLTRLREVTDNLEIIKEQQIAKELADSFLKKVNVGEFTSQEELLTIKKEGNTIIGNLNANSRLNKFVKEDLIKQIDKTLSVVERYLTVIVSKITEIFDMCYEIKNLREANELLAKIKYILSKKLREEDRTDVEAIGETLQDFVNNVEKALKVDNLLEQKEIFTNLLKNDIYEDVNGHIILEDMINDVDEEIKQLEEAWIRRYLSINLKDIKAYNVNECFNWLEDTKVLPYYLSNDTLDKYKSINNMINRRVTDLKVESIIVIFKELDIDEKKKCLEYLGDILAK